MLVMHFHELLKEHFRNKQKKLLETIKKDQEVKELTEKQLHDVVKSFLSSYTKEHLIVEDKKDEISEETDKEGK